MQTAEWALLLPDRIRAAEASIKSVRLESIGWSVGLTLLAFAVGRLVAWGIVRSAQRWAKRTDTLSDHVVAEHLPRPLRVLLPAIAISLVLPILPLRSAAFDHFVLVAIIASAGWTAFRLLLVIEGHLARQYDFAHDTDVRARARYTRLSGFRNIGGFVIVLVTVAFALMTFDTVRSIGTGLLASAGVAGIVLGFAAQKTIATLFAGVQLAVAQPIRVGDIVVVEGEWGTIEEIALTYVVLRVWDLRRLVLPVQYFIEKPFQNWTRGKTALLGTVELRLDYSVPVEAIRAELARVLDGSKWWDKASSGVQVTDASEKTMLVRVLVSAKNADDLWNLRCEAREKLIAFVQSKYPGALPKLRADMGRAA